VITDRLRAAAPPIVVGALGLVLWEGSLRLFNPKGFVLPPPSEILGKLTENWETVLTASQATGYVVVTGLIGGVMLGIFAAMLVSQFRIINETLTPLAVAVNAIPIVALAPIFNYWLGLTSPHSNQAVVELLVFFPVFVNTTRGLTDVAQGQLDLMASYAAGRWETLRRVRIPNALPYLFTSLRIAAALAVIGAIVAEYFGGRQDALGPVIVQSAGLARYAAAWAAVLAGTLMGMGLYLLVVVLERRIVPWRAQPDLM
jgi:NitT/TauT family transport system permease protein